MEEKIINAITKNRQSDETIKRMTERAVGHVVERLSVKELAGGLSNAVYMVEADGQKMVLKIATDQSVVTMRHEKDYVIVEANMLKTMEETIDIPVPKLIYFDDSRSICDVPYFFMSVIEGKSLATMDPRPDDNHVREIKTEVGRICRQITSIKAPVFGIPALPETYTDSNYEFVVTLFKLLYQDAEDKHIDVPGMTKEEFFKLLEHYSHILDEEKMPCYAHTDTWDGNLMIKDDRLSGIVDFAAILYGDPLITHDFHDFGDTPSKEFLSGFGMKALTDNERIRVQIYKIWQCLGMIVERGFRQYEDPAQYSWVIDIYINEVKRLHEMTSL